MYQAVRDFEPSITIVDAVTNLLSVGTQNDVRAMLVDDLLDVGRVVTGKIALDRRPLDWEIWCGRRLLCSPSVRPSIIFHSAEDGPRIQTSHRRVLIIEDNRDAREMFRMMLELDGHQMIEAVAACSSCELRRPTWPSSTSAFPASTATRSRAASVLRQIAAPPDDGCSSSL